MAHVARLHAVLWGIFSLGGIIAAFLLPILIYLTGIAYPLGLWPVANNDPTGVLVGRRLGILFIFLVVAGSLFHGLFRFQSTLGELGLKKYSRAFAGSSYTIFVISVVILVYYLLVLHPNFFKIALTTTPFV
jgi:fumarate reductase subunit D